MTTILSRVLVAGRHARQACQHYHHHPHAHHHPGRHPPPPPLGTFLRLASTKTKASTAAATTDPIGPSYFERKRAKKQERIDSYQAKVQRAILLKERRSEAPKDVLKAAFQTWWQSKIAKEQRWDRQARQQGKVWKLQVAVLVERMPQILSDPADFEKEFEELQAYRSQFGKEYPKEFSASLPGNGTAPVSDEELLALLPEGFTPAPRVTEADKSGTKDTVQRKLQDSIYLTIDGDFPMTTVLSKEDATASSSSSSSSPLSESLLEAAKRAVQEQGGTMLELYCPSQAPVAVHMEQYPPQPDSDDAGKDDDDDDDNDTNYFGTKTFYMRLQYDDGHVTLGKTKQSFAWLNRDEIVESMEPTDPERAKLFHYLL